VSRPCNDSGPGRAHYRRLTSTGVGTNLIRRWRGRRVRWRDHNNRWRAREMEVEVRAVNKHTHTQHATNGTPSRWRWGEVQTGARRREGGGGEAKQAGERAKSINAFKDGSPFLPCVQNSYCAGVLRLPSLSFLMLWFRACSRAYSRACSRACSLFSVGEMTTVGYFCGGIQYRTHRNLGDFYPSVLLVAYLYSTPWLPGAGGG